MEDARNNANPQTSLIHCIVGARPNFVKIAPIMRAIAASNHLNARLVHTGQHYDARMSEAFFEDLEIPSPDRYLGVGSGSHAQQTARIMQAYEPVLLEEDPDLLLVVGDVNSTLACSLVAAKLGVRVAHVEAGLRSYDRTMPEEINRLVTDGIADLLFTSCRDADRNLGREGIEAGKIHFVGNVMIDTLELSLPLAREKRSPERLALSPGEYAVATIHRPSNVDTPEGLDAVLTVFEELGTRLPILLPIHPRTAKRAEELGRAERMRRCPGLKLVDPLRYLEFLDLMRQARLVLTDSGGIQEETTILGIPCLTLRPNTERPITIEEGTNQLVGTNPAEVIAAALKVLETPTPGGVSIELWDGHAAERIVTTLETQLALLSTPRAR